MLVGIHTRYHRCEATLVAQRLALWFERNGCEVTLFTEDEQWPRLDSRYDGRVIRRSRTPFTEWAKRCSHIVWTGLPALPQLKWANDSGKHTVLLPDVRQLEMRHRILLQAAGSVVLPSRYAATLLHNRWQLDNCLPACWDPCVPITCRQGVRDPQRLRLLYPMELVTPMMQPSIIFMLSHLLGTSGVTLTIPYLPSRLNSQMRGFLDNLHDRYPDRVQLLRRVSWWDFPRLYCDADLVLWPSGCDSTGHGALLAAYSGTPVIAFQVPPLNEFLTPRNAVLVPCRHRHNNLGLPSACLDYRTFGEYLGALIDHPENIQELHHGERELITQRIEVFDAAWKMVLSQ